MKKISIVILLFALLPFSGRAEDMKLWYKQPANEWMKALPIGNGRLSGMVYGRVSTEVIALNEITMWSGQFDERQNVSCGKENLAKIRKHFFDGNPIDGNGAATNCYSSKASSPGTHLPIGDLNLKFGHYERKITDYIRTLDLENAVASVSYKYKDVNYYREYICSNPDQVLVINLKADKPGSISFDMTLNLLRQAEVKQTNNGLEFTGQATFPNLGPGGVNFIGKIQVETQNGSVVNDALCDGEQMLMVNNADEVKIIIDIRTNFNSPDYKNICATTVGNAINKSYDQLKTTHTADHSRLFKRMELSLGTSGALSALPTDTRWQQIKQGTADPGLDALFFQYGRYLLIASSREDSPLPANLQGVWNDNLACNMGWTCDYHLDINTQQNYWASNLGNLAECNMPWFDYIENLSVHGEETARTVYGSPGWVVHTVSNAWGYTGIGDGMAWSMFSAATAWVTSHLWTHYQYTQDKEFLQNKGYPIIRKATEFFMDYMVEHPHNGYLMSGPSNSPENTFKTQGWELAMSMMPTADRVLIYELYNACIEASEILNVDTEMRDQLRQALTKFPPIKIGQNGGIQEWFEDYEDAHPNHRHATHLLSLYPFSQISLERTPDLAVAAKKTIENKLNSEGWEDVEFSRANTVLFYARLKEAETAYTNFQALLKELTRENLFTMSPAGIAGAPYDIFIFDGNEAGAAAVAEMLLQSHEGYIELLPALPAAWKDGHIKGLCVPGGAEIDFEWKNGIVENAVLRATASNTFKVKVPGESNITTKQVNKGDSWQIK